MVDLGNDWDRLLDGEFSKPYYLELRKFLKAEYTAHTIYPDMYDIFNALKYTPYEKAKVLILGQDPYHEPNQAHGLAFSVKKGVEPPPSLKNIYKELSSDIGFTAPPHGELTKWAEQGVLLLNTSLTVRRSQANSHRGKGWEIFTDRVIELLNERESPMVFMLWGNNAKAKAPLITNSRHLILTAAHPSPLSAHNGFFGCKHFSKCNKFLTENGIAPVDWSL